MITTPKSPKGTFPYSPLGAGGSKKNLNQKKALKTKNSTS